MLEWIFGRRKKLLKAEVTSYELELLESSLWQSAFLSTEHRHQLVRWTRVFVAEKNWEGCNGVTVTELMKWSIATAAGLLVLAYPEWYFDRTATVLVHPCPYNVRVSPETLMTNPNPVLGGEFRRAGETIYRGPVVLNWQDIQAASTEANRGQHLVIHEFAHQLDMINSPSADGVPPLPAHIDENVWRSAMTAEYHRAREMVEQGYNILMNDYGLTQESEFFAVASELYFQLPHELREFHPNVHQLLKQFYVVDLSEIAI